MNSEVREPSAKYLVEAPYQHTAIGEIPSDWSITSLREATDAARPISYGIVQTGPNIAGGVPCIRVVDIDNGSLNTTGLICTSEAISAGYRRTLLQSGDLVMPLRGKVGDVAEVGPELKGANLTRGVALLSIRSGIDGSYCRQALAWSSTRRRLEQAMNGSALQEIPIAALRSFQIALPREEREQRAIAEALADVDALIAGLEKLIAKKRDLKQAAMQQLLTGQTRLPGFSGEWVSRSLGSLGVIYGGLVGKSKADFGHGSASYVPFVNVMANIRIDCGALEPVNVASTENQNRVLSGDLLFNGSSETPEEVALCALMTQTVEDLYLNSFCFGFRFKQGAEASGLFLTYLMRSQMGRELMKSLAQGSTRYNLSKSALLQAALVLPNLEEQTAIATVLSDMDADLAALESRLAKTHDLKQGMMQELLTGRTRLV